MLSTLNFDDEEFAKALKCARGKYQLALLRGVYEWNGVDLSGNARRWSWQYELSRRALVTRLESQNIKFVFFNLHWSVNKPLLLVGLSREVWCGENLRADFLKGLKYSNATDALKIALAKQAMFETTTTTNVPELLVKLRYVKARNRHNHLDWRDIKGNKKKTKSSIPTLVIDKVSL